MFFDSLAYILFFLAIWLLYQFVPDRQRWLLLLAASIGFYSALRAPLLLVAWAGVVLASYFCGLALARESDESRRKRLLWTGITANVGVLCVVKYLQGLMAALSPGLLEASRSSNLFLTIGVSYFALQAVSYLADVYLDEVEPERHLGYFALYLAFFPKLLQGPIERAGDLLPQLKARYEADYENLRSGALLFTWGLFKKVVVANRLAPYVDVVYGDPYVHGGVTLILATYMYALQILADFSGYTDMALGVARMFNIRLTQNFDSPYLAASVADFWRRWHISFSRWILDYIFKPLQVTWRSARTWGTAAALLLTFFFSGLWHGAAWTFVVWGLLHGLYMATSVLTKSWRNRVLEKVGLLEHPWRRVIQVCITFNLVAFAWIFFRANSLPDAWHVATHLFAGVGSYVAALATSIGQLTPHSSLWDPILVRGTLASFGMVTVAVILMFLGDFLKKRIQWPAQPAFVRWTVYYLLIGAISYLGVYDASGFVYLQF